MIWISGIILSITGCQSSNNHSSDDPKAVEKIVEEIVVDYGTGSVTKARLSKLTIEDGTVDNIVHKGTTYTPAQWAEYVASLS